MAVDIDLPAAGIGCDPFGIDGGDDALAAETFRARKVDAFHHPSVLYV